MRLADDQQQRAQGFLTRARWLRPVELRDVAFLRANIDRTIKITLPGPFTMSRQAKNDFYEDEEELAMDYAAAVNAEIRDLKAAGADVIQLDEPWLQARADHTRISFSDFSTCEPAALIELQRRGAQNASVAGIRDPGCT